MAALCKAAISNKNYMSGNPISVIITVSLWFIPPHSSIRAVIII
jgi:hypothetical protein